MATLVSIAHVQECVDRLNSCKELHHRLLHSHQPYLPPGGEKITSSQSTSGKSEQQPPPPPPPVKRSQKNDKLIVKACRPISAATSLLM